MFGKYKNLTLFFQPFFYLTIILLLGLFLRTWDLSRVPVEVQPDELTNVVSVRSIFETGRDFNGKLFPYIYYKVQLHPPIYGYFEFLEAHLFGYTPFNLRFPAAIFGVITILLLYLIVIEVTTNKIVALIAAFLLSILPWHIHFSRVGYDPASLLPFLLGGLLFLIKAVTQNKLKFFMISGIFLGLTFYTYLSGAFYALVFLMGIFLFNCQKLIQNKSFYKGLIVFILIILPFFQMAVTEPLYYERSQRISTFSSGLNSNSLAVFLNNYMAHLNADFLFQTGDPNLRHGAHTGVLYLFMLPFIILGLVFSFKVIKRSWQNYFLYLWLISFPLGGSLTNDGVPHATRTLIGAPLFCILAAIGIYLSFKYIHQKTKSGLVLFLTTGLLIFVIIFSLGSFLFQYLVVYPKISGPWWHYGEKETFEKIRSLEKNYQTVCLGNVDYWNDETYIGYYMRRTNLTIITDLDNQICQKPKTILVTTADKLAPASFKLVHQVYGLDHNLVYHIYTRD